MRQRQVNTTKTTDFGAWLRHERSAFGLTMEMLSERADTAPAVVSNLERGTRNPSRTMVTRIAAALSGPGADEHTSAALLNAGLNAAGFASAQPEPSAVKSPIPTSVIEFFDGTVSDEEMAYVEKTIAMIGNARMRLPARLGQ